MISFIKGRLEQISEHGIVLENYGIGYFVYVSPQTIARLSKTTDEIKIYTYMHVKEDGIALYGFLSSEEIDIFNLLIMVSGIGPKVALGVLGAMEPRQVTLAIVTEDFTALSKAPGVGKKTAQRIVLELKDRIKGHEVINMSDRVGSTQGVFMGTSEKQDAIEGLIALGYSRGESVKAVMETALPEMSTEQIIKSALRKLSE